MKLRIEGDEKDQIVDDLCLGFTGKEKIEGVHLERMDNAYYWLGITLGDGRTVHVDIFKTKAHKMKIEARIRNVDVVKKKAKKA